MFKEGFLNFLCCPNCRGDLFLESKKLKCKKCDNRYEFVNGIPLLLNSMTQDVKLSQEKWDLDYKKKFDKKKMSSLKKGYESTYAASEMKHLSKAFGDFKNKKYLEIGSGTFFVGQKLAKLGAFVVGIDYSLNALMLSREYLKQEKIENYLLICGDITKMPFKDNAFDLLYGGGVIEHFKDTVGIVKENHRVLKKGGVAFNTVPYLNLGSLTYRQAWGNIPNAPILKGVAEFVHIKLLKSRRMIYGYEYSFTKGQLKRIFKRAGFSEKNIEVEKFEVPLLFEFIKTPLIKRTALWLSHNTNLFWPVIYIKSIK